MNQVFIDQIFAYHFRNLKMIKFKPSSQINIFFGKNGQGKTNLLEAICLASSLKTIRSVRNRDLISFGKEQSHIKASISGQDAFTVEVDVFLQGKKVQIANKAIKSSSTINQKTAVVTFVPDDLNIVTGSASFRRHLLDQTASGFFPTYLALYRRFEKALLDRNRLLKSSMLDKAELEAFSEVFTQTAAPLIKARREAIQILRSEFIDTINEISAGIINADIAYECAIADSNEEEEQIRKALHEKLESLKKEEIFRKTTLYGPHLDDICIQIDSHLARHIASRGQARAVILALKTAQINCTAALRNLTPILLLDDVMGELDPNNTKRLLNTIQHLGAQTFITTTHLNVLPSDFTNYQSFEIEAGEIK